MRLVPPCCLLAIFALASCDRGTPRVGDDTAAGERISHRTVAGCYRSPTSVMGRTTPLDGHASVAPGWLRFEASTGPDSGAVQLVDADGAQFQASWHRPSRDSIEVRGFDDFMRIALRAALSDSALSGLGLLTSDADVQRDAAGMLEPLRREWALSARKAPCDGVPVLAK